MPVSAALPAVATLGSLAATGAGMAMAAGSRPRGVPQRSLGQEIDEILSRRGAILASERTYLPEHARLERQVGLETLFGRGEAERLGDIGTLEAQIEAQRRMGLADVGQVEAMAPRVMELYRREVPYMGLLQQVLDEAGSQLRAGTTLDEAAAAQVRQRTRAALAERGLGAGQAGAMAEATTLGLAGEQLRQARMQQALAAIQSAIAGTPDLFRLLTGRETRSGSMLPGAGGQSGALLPQLLGYAGDLYGGNLRGRMEQWRGRQEHTAQMASALGALGGILGRMGQGGGGGSLSSR